jgi:biopolymer transport protein ExbD
VGGEAMNPPPGLELPNSSAESPPAISLIIAIDHNSISLGGEYIVSIQEAVSSDDLMIGALDDKLQSVIEQRDELAIRRGQTEFDDEIVTIQGDRRIEFRVLRKVMYTLNYNGFENIALAVIKTS